MSTQIWDGITEEQYNLWKNNPVTIAMFKYYGDFGEVLQRTLLEKWKGGTLVLMEEQEMRGRVNTLEEIVGQPYSVIREFYTEPVNNEESDGA